MPGRSSVSDFSGWSASWARRRLGVRRSKYDPPAPFTWTHDQEAEVAKLKVGEEEQPWEEYFTNEKDILEMKCTRFVYEGKTYENLTVQLQYQTLHLEGTAHDLNKAKFFAGNVSELTFRRDAMGFGDVKFIACIGAFLGWKSVFFTVMAGSVIGALIAMVTIAMGRREWSAKIPFGPYLSLGALLWMFAGPESDCLVSQFDCSAGGWVIKWRSLDTVSPNGEGFCGARGCGSVHRWSPRYFNARPNWAGSIWNGPKFDG